MGKIESFIINTNTFYCQFIMPRLYKFVGRINKINSFKLLLVRVFYKIIPWTASIKRRGEKIVGGSYYFSIVIFTTYK